MSAPQSVVRTVQKVLGCHNDVTQRVFGGRPHITCQQFGHSDEDWTERGCPVAVNASDSAWKATLLAAAERIDAECSKDDWGVPSAYGVTLRCWAEGPSAEDRP